MKRNSKSQIATIITLVIALIILFTIVFINISKVSNIKTITSQAADKSALGLASQIGSICHYYKDGVFKGGAEKTMDGEKVIERCVWKLEEIQWIQLVKLVIGILGVATFFIIPFPTIFFLTGLALIVSAVMTEATSKRLQGMSFYTGIRENALSQALSATQSDEVECKATGGGKFSCEDGYTYDLSAIPEMLNKPRVPRFQAWYYTKRLPLIDDVDLRKAVDKFVHDPIMGLMRFTDIDQWDATKWEVKKLSYVITPGSGLRDYDVTCASGCSPPGCPEWVKDAATEKLRILRLNEKDEAYDGFLKDKFMSLLRRLDNSYDLSFCNILGCSDVDRLIEDLRLFLIRAKEVLNMPVTPRVNTLTEWFPLFYDFKKHNPDRTSIDDEGHDPYKDLNLNDDYIYDIYLRLWRDQVYISSWIEELEKLNNEKIIPKIPPDYGSYCEEGRGDVVYQCYTEVWDCYCTEEVEVCDEYDCWTEIVCVGNDCQNLVDARWKGIYGTCTGSGFDHSSHPVCQNGDLYGGKPSWCCNLRDIPCKSNSFCGGGCTCCSIPPTQTAAIDVAYNFQGQFSWDHPDPDSSDGPTEVRQAIRILYALDDDIAKIKMTIAALADAQEREVLKEPLRNEIVYAWKDKFIKDRPQFSHFVRVQISGYPKEPYITETISWWGNVCQYLHNYEGEFEIRVSRYDQDQPTPPWWTLRRRRQPKLLEYPPASLDAVIADVFDNGKIDTTQGSVSDITDNYAITSRSKAHYGPEKEDITIIKTEGD